MKASGVYVDKKELDQLFVALEGKSIPDLVAAGKKKQVVMPSGGGGARAPAAAGAAAAAPVEEAKKEEAEDVDMGGLFGDDDDY